jgi:hypothetical protein
MVVILSGTNNWINEFLNYDYIGDMDDLGLV